MTTEKRIAEFREAFAELERCHNDATAHVIEHTNGTELACSQQPDCDSLRYIEDRIADVQAWIGRIRDSA